MTVNSISQSFSLSAIRFNLTARPVTTAATAPTASAKAEPDRVTLSSVVPVSADDAANPAVDGQAVPVSSVKPPSRAERRADALFDTLDADHDGAVTEQEFTEGAAALLRHAGARHRARGGDGGPERLGRPEDGDRPERAEHRESQRLERKLERAFSRVDANQDGSVDKEELTSALAQAGATRRGGAPPATPGAEPGGVPAPGDTPQKGGVPVSFSFTYVSIAVQRYTVLQTPETNRQPQAA